MLRLNMKIIISVLLLIGSAINLNAEVFYCFEKDANGFNSENGNYERVSFDVEKFTIDFDMPSLTINSSTIKFYEDTSCNMELAVISCANGVGTVFTIDNNKTIYNSFNFVMADTYGRGDSILVSHGVCEKF